MLAKFSNSWRLAKESYGVLQQDKELMVFPVLSTVMTLILLVSFFVPVFAVLGGSGVEMSEGAAKVLSTFLLFMFYFIGYLVVLFCNTALLHCAKMRFEGGDPTVKDGLRAGFKHFRSIAGWAAIGGTLGVILANLEERLGFLGTIIRGLVGGAWTVITYFAVPVMIFESVGPIEGIKRSKAIISKTWGEAAVAAVGMRAAQGVFTGGGFFILLGAIIGSIALGQVHILSAGAVVALLIWVGSAIVFSCLSQIYCAALYVYATTNEPPAAFRKEVFESAFSSAK
jgi:hypothetical protein